MDGDGGDILDSWMKGAGTAAELLDEMNRMIDNDTGPEEERRCISTELEGMAKRVQMFTRMAIDEPDRMIEVLKEGLPDMEKLLKFASTVKEFSKRYDIGGQE